MLGIIPKLNQGATAYQNQIIAATAMSQELRVYVAYVERLSSTSEDPW